MIVSLIAAAAMVATYNCEVDGPKKVSVEGITASAKNLGLPEELKRWKFIVRLEQDSRPIKIAIDWPGDPIQASGETFAVPIGKNAYAFSKISGGPCLLTETACISQFTLADQPDGTAKVIVAPTALTSDLAKDQREPFLAVLQGTCARTETKK